MKMSLLLLMALTVSQLSFSQESIDQIDEYFTRMENLGFSGALILAQDGEVLLNKGYGYVNRKTKAKTDQHSVFSTGSVTKQFTAAAIMKLEDMGLLSSEDLLSMHLSGLPKDKRQITLHHLLTHTSGLPLALSDTDFKDISKEEYLKQALASKLLFSSGDRFSYSNIGYSLLAMVVEKVSKVTYEEFLNKNLFTPAGMSQTGYSIPNWDEKNFAHIYNGSTDNGTTERFTKPTWHLYGNGGILSTTTDMYLWVQALSGNKLLSDNVKKKMFTPHQNNYGYGWDVLDQGGLRQHNGGSYLGCGAEIRWFVNDGLFTMIFSNATIGGDQGFQLVRNDLEALSFGDEIPMPPKVEAVETEVRLPSGQYKLPSGDSFQIEEKGGTSVMVFDSQDMLDFILIPEKYQNGNGYAKLNNKFKQALKGVEQGDFSGFEFTGAIKDIKFEIENEIKLSQIKDPVYKVYKSFPTQNPKGGANTIIAINDGQFDGLSLLMTVVTLNEKYMGLGVGFGPLVPESMMLIPLGDSNFQLYNVNSKLSAQLMIKSEDGGIKLSNNGVSMKAVKIND